MEAFFWTLVLLSQVLGIASVILIATWVSEYGGGYDWECRNGIGSYHYMFMTIGMVFLFAEGMLSFRVLHRLRLSYIAEKAIHATIQSIVIVLVGIGIHAAFVCKDAGNPERTGKDMYSLHSWIGMGTIILFFGQWIYGIVMTIALRKLDRTWQDRLLPNHAFTGILIFAFSISSCVTGANEMALIFIEKYKHIVSSGHLVNAYGVCLMVFAAVIGYITYKPAFQIPERRRHPGSVEVPTCEGATNSGDDRPPASDGVHQTYGAIEQTSFTQSREKEEIKQV